MDRQGILTVNVLRAKLLKDQDVFGKMDPFCEVKVGHQVKTTKVKEEAGLTPEWNQIL
jgi:Ca2+-dependent lipid-binding protein